MNVNDILPHVYSSGKADRICSTQWSRADWHCLARAAHLFPRSSQTAAMNVIRTLKFQFLMVVIFKLHKTLIIHLNGSVFSILSKTWNVKNVKVFYDPADHEHVADFYCLFTFRFFFKTVLKVLPWLCFIKFIFATISKHDHK